MQILLFTTLEGPQCESETGEHILSTQTTLSMCNPSPVSHQSLTLTTTATLQSWSIKCAPIELLYQ